MGVGIEIEEGGFRGLLPLTVALSDALYSFFAELKTVVFVLLCLLGISLAPYKGVALL
jgi:hypothetical protein